MPQNVPLVRPACRPTRFMCSEAGIVASAPPSTQQLTGSVASVGLGASASPASPLIATSVELFVKSVAWQATSSPTLRRGLFFFLKSGGEEHTDPVCGARGPAEKGQREKTDSTGAA